MRWSALSPRHVAALAGALGVAAWLAMAFFDTDGAMRGLLVAAIFWLAVPLGGLAILMTHVLTGGRWGEIAVPIARAMAASLPAVAAAFAILLLFGTQALFSWTAPTGELPEIVRRKTAYLNVPFFAVRTLLYFAIWFALAFVLGAWNGAPRRGTGGAAAGMILWVFTTTFFAFDWLMSLEPLWYSDIFGLLFGVQTAVAALALVLIVAWSGRTGASGAAADTRLVDLASLLLVLVLGRAFLDFSQYIIIWMGNMPDEIGWFIHRSGAGWRIVAGLTIALLFVVPFLALMHGAAKRRRAAITALCVAVLAGHALHIYWLVLPTFHPRGFALSWSAIAAWIGLGGLSFHRLSAGPERYGRAASHGHRDTEVAR